MISRPNIQAGLNMRELSGINIGMLIGIAVAIFVVALIIFIMLKMLQKDTDIVKIDRYLKSGNFKKALAVGLNYIKAHPDDYLIKYYIGQAYEGLNDRPNAIVYYEKASVAVNNTQDKVMKVQIFLKIAELYRKQNKNKEALGYYAMVLDQEPRQTRALYPAAEILFTGGNYAKARNYLETLTGIQPNNLKAQFVLARVYIRLNQVSDAAARLKLIITTAKASEEEMKQNAQMLLADVFLAMKNYSEAINTLKPLLDVKDYSEEVIVKIVDCFIRLNQTIKAIDIAQKNLDRVGQLKKAELLYQIGSAFFKDGETYKAAVNWSKAYSVNPNLKDLKDITARYHLIVSNPKMENYFTSNDTIFQNFALKLLKASFVKQIIKRNTFWAMEIGDKSYILYRMPYPITKNELADIENIVSQQLHSSTMILYALFGTSKDSENTNGAPSKFNVIMGEEMSRKISEA